MAGIYFHIPFCKQACHYCNFHFSTSLRHREAMTTAMLAELDLQRAYLGSAAIESVYFGGGTPSLLTINELVLFFEKINQLYTLLPDAEITLEANPDDLTAEWLADLRRYTPVSRLSIGIQSFSDADLRWMNRAHTADHARRCIDVAQSAGFDQLTIDLIYGSPTTSDEQWADNLRIALAHGVPHLSCYCLTVEEGTALGTRVRKGRQQPVDEEQAARQLEYLMTTTEAAGYEQYEISNFARDGQYARHNSNYWRGVPYLGIGPSAHSYDGTSRQWNVANNALYINELSAQKLPFEREEISPPQRYNEYVMTMLRTTWGCSAAHLHHMGQAYATHFERGVQRHIEAGWVTHEADAYRLTRAGRLLADYVAADLFWEG
jgi:oxygen-independent coproporphyrinogen III oxidase